MFLLIFSQQVEERKSWLDGNPSSSVRSVDVSRGVLGINDFINSELILYSHADNVRAIPSLIDGLKVTSVFSMCFSDTIRVEYIFHVVLVQVRVAICVDFSFLCTGGTLTKRMISSDEFQFVVVVRQFIGIQFISLYIGFFSFDFQPGQRKVLFGCFKRKLTSEVKVAQLSGYVAEHAAYHHGEASLHSTIINMAQVAF